MFFLPTQIPIGATCPVIFFGSRTHSQLSQVVRELRKTPYTHRVSMTVLSSREHACIHEEVSKSSFKNEDCQKLEYMSKKNKDAGCSFFNNLKALSQHPKLYPGAELGVFDIEDLVGLGREVGGCPYFTAQAKLLNADIVFLPYNYLIDPQIRERSSISLEGNIVVIDEGHNIEDAARDAVSITVTIPELKAVATAFRLLHAAPAGLKCVQNLVKMTDMLIEWIQSNESILEKQEDSWGRQWVGKEGIELFFQSGINPDTFHALADNVKELAENIFGPNNQFFKWFDKNAYHTLQSLFAILELVMGNHMKNVPDYCLSIQKKVVNPHAKKQV